MGGRAGDEEFKRRGARYTPHESLIACDFSVASCEEVMRSPSDLGVMPREFRDFVYCDGAANRTPQVPRWPTRPRAVDLHSVVRVSTPCGDGFDVGSLERDVRRTLAAEGIAYKQHRLRSTCARRLHEAGYPDSAIMEILGWSSMAMLRRYLGKIPVAQLKRYPTTLERVFGRAVRA
jgi:hypothetical protein